MFVHGLHVYGMGIDTVISMVMYWVFHVCTCMYMCVHVHVSPLHVHVHQVYDIIIIIVHDVLGTHVQIMLRGG